MDEIVYVNRVSYVINSWRKIQIKYFKEFITIKKKKITIILYYTLLDASGRRTVMFSSLSATNYELCVTSKLQMTFA